jgi:hypothetical protein
MVPWPPDTLLCGTALSTEIVAPVIWSAAAEHKEGDSGAELPKRDKILRRLFLSQQLLARFS